MIEKNQADGRAGCTALKDARQHLHPVSFGPTRGDLRLPWATPIEIGLQRAQVDDDVGGTPLDDRTQPDAMRLAEGGDSKEGSGLAAHQ